MTLVVQTVNTKQHDLMENDYLFVKLNLYATQF